ncbi:MAG: PH domain-containing protein [Candidatus ainarchaeum sp.]|nr:PH domain-containing protein [Candidatus ainarchaeum sp.]
MAHSFHPSPVVAGVKILLYLLLVTIFLVLVQDLLRGLFLTFLAIAWLGGIIFVALAVLAAKLQTITLEQNTIAYASGLLATRRTVLPYAKITETSYAQGLLERILGVGTVSIDTAGGAAIAIHVSNVRYNDIKALLQEINKKTGKGSGI